MENHSITSALAISLLTLMLSGCVDLGKVGLNPEVKTAYFNLSGKQLSYCLKGAFLQQGISMDEDTSYSDSQERYNLRKEGQLVGWLDIADSGKRNSSAFVYYGKGVKGFAALTLSAFRQCDVS